MHPQSEIEGFSPVDEELEVVLHRQVDVRVERHQGRHGVDGRYGTMDGLVTRGEKKKKIWDLLAFL